MMDYTQHPTLRTYLPQHVAGVLKRLRQAQRRARYLFDHNKLLELRAQTEAIQHIMREYYRPSPALLRNPVVLRALNKLRKKEELRVIYNQALVQHRGLSGERAVELLVVGIEEITNAIEGEKMRLGFMDTEEEAAMQRQTLESIAEWQMELTKFYYYLGLASQQGTMEVALAAVLKSLDMVKQLYQFNNRLRRSKCIQMKEQDNLSELIVVCQIWQKVSHSKKFGNVSTTDLLETLGSLIQSDNTISKRQECQYNKVLMFEEMVQLQMSLPDEHQTTNSTPIVAVKDIKKLHFFCLSLMSKLQETKKEQFQTTSNLRNVLLNVILASYLYKRHLSPCSEMDEQIDFFHKNYSIKQSRKQAVTISSLLNTLGVNLEEIKQPESMRDSIFQNKTYQKADISAQYQRQKRKNQLRKDKRTTSKQDLRSKQKIKTIKTETKTIESNKKIHKEKVKCQYMLKPRETCRRNHLVDAINKIGSQTCIVGYIAQKRPSTTKKIAIQAITRASKSKEAKRDVRERLTANQKKQWR